ncbi:hypothetical protein PT974_08848 [Cladobotryum mycophilum]|uniref:Uncharacterized protein n=1 Tax=Cladobotryum mycophilum TaxID=491253 RepID=A0ABR0SEN3_9HYPO
MSSDRAALDAISKAGFGGSTSTSSLTINPTDAGGIGASPGGSGGGDDGGAAAGTPGSSPKTSSASPTATASPSPSSSSSTELPVPTVIQFDDADNFARPNQHVYDLDDSTTKIFKWGFNDTFSLKRIRWYARNNTATVFDDGANVIGDTSFDSSAAELRPFGKITNTSAQLFLTDSKLTSLHWSSMAIKIDWETSFATGYSESGIFTVAQGARSDEVSDYNGKAESNSADSKGTEFIHNSGTDSGSVSGGGGGGGTSKSSSKKGGLSTGAKAGIGVGCALIALLLVEEECQGGYRDQPPVNSFIADKEDARARVAESPESPYSDDGHRQSHDAVNRPIARGHDIEDEALPRASSSRADGAETPQAGVSRHLVEDGMTREEILRLEEEERQLDAEIERAARGCDESCLC